MLVKMLWPRNSKLIYGLAIITNFDNPVLNIGGVVLVLGVNVIFTHEDNK